MWRFYQIQARKLKWNHLHYGSFFFCNIQLFFFSQIFPLLDLSLGEALCCIGGHQLCLYCFVLVGRKCINEVCVVCVAKPMVKKKAPGCLFRCPINFTMITFLFLHSQNSFILVDYSTNL